MHSAPPVFGESRGNVHFALRAGARDDLQLPEGRDSQPEPFRAIPTLRAFTIARFSWFLFGMRSMP